MQGWQFWFWLWMNYEAQIIELAWGLGWIDGLMVFTWILRLLNMMNHCWRWKRTWGSTKSRMDMRIAGVAEPTETTVPRQVPTCEHHHSCCKFCSRILAPSSHSIVIFVIVVIFVITTSSLSPSNIVKVSLERGRPNRAWRAGSWRTRGGWGWRREPAPETNQIYNHRAIFSSVSAISHHQSDIYTIIIQQTGDKFAFFHVRSPAPHEGSCFQALHTWGEDLPSLHSTQSHLHNSTFINDAHFHFPK